MIVPTMFSALPSAFLVTAFLLAGSGCSPDNAAAGTSAGEAREIPQVEVLKARMVVERDYRVELTVDRIATYRDKRIQTFEGLSFREYGPDGVLRLEGDADRGVFFLDSENIELTGTVRFHSLLEGAELESESLSWDQAERLLAGPPDGKVLLLRDDGSAVEGTGFRLKGRENRILFSRDVSGRFSAEETSQ
ncbi:hypothetical protein SAMN05920897_11180 [Alkalispirochaeta americana]|uniref:LPS export ABC transporter protein LptC n=1 Tax=Alkalispirochaeta americana TaxID=159291 RepID=A0A1N6U288_9SPIO|nr:LPS export ABC transporter periplasmic protein LptC [Alkalispirochaeta americana]SIQ59758.1 hypothetical protein SAMN05920897_11180 [Alkalispirochaeta americana]